MKSRKHKLLITFSLFVSIFLLLESPAYADVLIYWGLYGALTPLMLSIATWGTAFIVVLLLETVVFIKMCRYEWEQALHVAFVINLFSTAIGGVIAGAYSMAIPCIILLPVLLLIGILGTFSFKWYPWWYALPGVVTIVIGFFGTAKDTWIVTPLPFWGLVLALMYPVIYGFGWTLLSEGWAVREFLKTTINWKAMLTANVLSYIFLAVLILFA